jgi:hypothetical protein
VTTYTNPTTNHVWSYQDCYSDNVNNIRALPNGLANTANTVEGTSFSSSALFGILPTCLFSGCLSACDAANYTLCGEILSVSSLPIVRLTLSSSSGIQYHGQCWGANALSAGSTAQGAGACSYTCDGNPLQYCGGNGGPTGATFELYSVSTVRFLPFPLFPTED